MEEVEEVEEEGVETYEVGERVLLFVGQHLLESEITKIDLNRPSEPYFLHIFGWKDHQWADYARLNKLTADNLLYQQELFDEHPVSKSMARKLNEVTKIIRRRRLDDEPERTLHVMPTTPSKRKRRCELEHGGG